MRDNITCTLCAHNFTSFLPVLGYNLKISLIRKKLFKKSLFLQPFKPIHWAVSDCFQTVIFDFFLPIYPKYRYILFNISICIFWYIYLCTSTIYFVLKHFTGKSANPICWAILVFLIIFKKSIKNYCNPICWAKKFY